MERLTERVGECIQCNDRDCRLSYCDRCCEQYQLMVDKLADYEDKQEQGLLIELPVAIGEEVYCIKNNIDGYAICKNRVLSYQTAPKEVGGIVVRGYMGVTLGIVGKNVFATESEAEEALAKMGE